MVQDAVGNDAEDFILGPGLSVTVSNGSTVAPTVATRPTGLVAMAAGDTRIDLSWNAPADNGGRAITGYRIERSTDGGLTYPATPLVANHDAKEDGAIVRAYRDTDVMPGTTRHYRVSAINMIGTGPVSDAEHATTSNCAPGAPTGLGLTAVAAALGATSTQNRPLMDRADRPRHAAEHDPRLPHRAVGGRQRALDRACGGHRGHGDGAIPT